MKADQLNSAPSHVIMQKLRSHERQNMVYEIWLAGLKGAGLAQKKHWLQKYGGFAETYARLRETGENLDFDLEEAKKIEQACYRKGIWIRNCFEYDIPEQHDLPLILYCRGTWRPFGESVGIVGTRHCTEYGKKMTVEITEKLAAGGVTIISGMAKGIDGYAHSSAIKKGGYTVAVFGNGPDICFPSEHRSLMDAILKTGLVISEYPPGFHGNASTFPQRNRIIAAFSDSVLVVESRAKGGALITAAKAKQYNKPVYAIPGRLDSPESEGTNRLIAEKKAGLWLPSLHEPTERQLSFTFSREEAAPEPEILKLLRLHDGHMPAEDMAQALGLTLSSLFDEVIELELNDVVKTEGDIIWLL